MMKPLTDAQKTNTQTFQEPQLVETNPDFEVRSLDAICVNESHLQHKWYHNLKYVAAGMLLGILFVKAEVISWFRIQEMFRLQSFHMYGIIGSAVMVGALSVWLIKRFNIKTIMARRLNFTRRHLTKGKLSVACCLAWAGQ